MPRNPAAPEGTVTVTLTAIASSPDPGSVHVLSPPYVEPNAAVSKLRAFAAPLTMTPPTLRVSMNRQGVFGVKVRSDVRYRDSWIARAPVPTEDASMPATP